MLGGLIIPTNLAVAHERILDIAGAYFEISKEAKWSRVSKWHLPYYTAMVDSFFHPRDWLTPCDFHSVAIEKSRQNHERFSDGDKEIGFNKEIYQLVLKFARLYPDGIYHVHLDKRETKQDNEETRAVLNNGISKRLGRRDAPVRRVQMRDSKRVLTLQLVDILLGGVAYQLNGHFDKPGASPPKRTLSKHITDLAGIHDVTIDTPMRGKFTLWHRRLQD